MTAYTDAVDARYREDLEKFERLVRHAERIRCWLELAEQLNNRNRRARPTPCRQT